MEQKHLSQKVFPNYKSQITTEGIQLNIFQAIIRLPWLKLFQQLSSLVFAIISNQQDEDQILQSTAKFVVNSDCIIVYF